MKFEEKTTIKVDDNPNGSHEEEIGSLLIGECAIFSWEDQQSKYGYRSNDLTPAYYKGIKSWLHSWFWNAQGQYSASGEGEEVIEFEEGVKALLIHGAYEWMYKK